MDREETAAASAFARYVNLSARELELWLATDASAGSDGHDDGREVLRLLRTAPDARTGQDVAVMRRVVDHIVAERERRPDGEAVASPWRNGLMNRGHDPLTWTAAPPHVAAVASPARIAPDPRTGGAESDGRPPTAAASRPGR